MNALEFFVGMTVVDRDKLYRKQAASKCLKRTVKLSFLRKNAKRIWLVLEGDDGGQVYLTVRLDMLGEGACFAQLLKRLDTAAWPANDGDGRGWYLQLTEHQRLGVNGGMGGGRLRDGVWLHEEFHRDKKWRKMVREELKLKKGTRIS